MPTVTSQTVSQLQRSIARAIYGKEEAIQLALITLLARGHLLIEDVPGVGKTTLAQALAKSFHCIIFALKRNQVIAGGGERIQRKDT